MKKLGITLNGKEYIVTVREIIDDDKNNDVVDVDNNSSDNTVPDNTEFGTNTEPEVPEEDKLTVARARKIRNFLSQPFHVAEKFSGYKGAYVHTKDTIRSFKQIVEGKVDHIPEQYFLYASDIDEVINRAKNK